MNPTTATVKTIDRAIAEEYLRLHAEQAERKPRLEKLRDEIVEQLEAGAQSPADLPYLLLLRKSARILRDYKTPLYDALRRLFKSPVRADAQLEKIEAEFESQDVTSLCVEINKEFAKSLGQ